MPDTASDPTIRSLLRQLTSFAALDPADWVARPGAPTGLDDLGVAWDEDAGHVLVSVPEAIAEVWLRGPQGKPRAALWVEGGLVRLPLLESSGLSLALSPDDAPALRVPTRSTPIPTPDPVQGLDLIEQALALGSDREAAALLREVAHSIPSPVRARLALEAAEAIDALTLERGNSTPPNAAIGRCETVLAWQSWCGFVTVRAPVARDGEPSSDLDPELAAALERGGRLGREHARRAHGLPQGTSTPPPTMERTESLLKLRDPGGTLALAAALAACSQELEAPVPSNLLALGGLDEQGRIAPLPRKRLTLALAALARERPGSRLVLAATNVDDARALARGLELLPASTLEEAVRHALGEPGPAAATDTRLLDEAERDERDYHREEALAKARAFLAQGQGTPSQRLRGQWLEGACLVHLGRPEEARTAFDLAWRIIRDPQRPGTLDRAVAVYLALAEADGFTDLFRYSEALSALEHGRDLARGSIPLLSKVDFFQGLVLVHAGRPAEAVVLLERACARALPADAPRFHCWLGLALTETGDHGEAHTELERGLVLAAEAGGAAMTVNQAYLLLACARLELRRLDPDQALARADAGLELAQRDARISPYPLSSLLHARGAALLLRGDREPGVTALEEARGLETKSTFQALVFGFPELERARALLEREPETARARDALRRSRELVSNYPPARARFARELAALTQAGIPAARALGTILRTLKY